MGIALYNRQTAEAVSFTNLTVSGIQVFSGTPDVVSAAGPISLTTAITHVVTNGVGTVLSLAAGVEGQEKIIILKTLTSAGQTDVITPAGGGAGFTTITLSAVGHSVHLIYSNGKWTIVSVNLGGGLFPFVNSAGVVDNINLTVA